MNILEQKDHEIAYLRSELAQMIAHVAKSKQLNKKLLVELADAATKRDSTIRTLGEAYQNINTLNDRIAEQDALLEDLTDIPEPEPQTNAVQSHEQWLAEQRQAEPVRWSPEQEKLARERHDLITKDIGKWTIRTPLKMRGLIVPVRYVAGIKPGPKRPFARLAKIELDLQVPPVVKSTDPKHRNFWRWNK